jgi:hypothetical protein
MLGLSLHFLIQRYFLEMGFEMGITQPTNTCVRTSPPPPEPPEVLHAGPAPSSCTTATTASSKIEAN